MNGQTIGKAWELCEEIRRQVGEPTPAYLFRRLHYAGYPADVAAYSVHRMFPGLAARELCALIVGEYNDPLPSRDEVASALRSCGYGGEEIAEAVAAEYPGTQVRYAARLEGDHLAAPAHAAYDFGAGDMTVEAWVRAERPGTVLARKGAPGGLGNGGFLLVVKDGGAVKFATDDGMGFYEVNSEPTSLLDGGWHHVLATREGGALRVYADFERLDASVRTNRFTPLEVGNANRVTIGFTDQHQEQFNGWQGSVGEVRLWSRVVEYAGQADWERRPWEGDAALAARWSFAGRDGHDTSLAGNDLTSSKGEMSFESWTLPV